MISNFLMKLLLIIYIFIVLVSLIEENYIRALYWFGAALITTAVIWGMK